MVEAPKIRIYYNSIKKFIGRKIDRAIYKKPEYGVFEGKIINDIYYIGKRTWIVLKSENLVKTYVRIHMFGKVIVNEPYRERLPQLQLFIGNDTVYFYVPSIKFFDESNYLENTIGFQNMDLSHPSYDMTEHIDYVLKNKQDNTDENICDFILDQYLFPGVGNIIKNEGLYLYFY